ncbi:MAG: S53 family serine peptidase [Ktedonobacteraceae bacterium]
MRSDVRRNFLRNVLFLALALVLLGGALAGLASARATMQPRIALSTQVLPILKHAKKLHSTRGEQKLDLSIGLRLRNAARARALLRELADPRSANYRRYLSPTQFKAMFAPTPDQVQRVQAYLRGQGLQVGDVAPNNLLINASGTVAQVQQSFQTQIDTYQARSRVFYANSNPPSMPADVGQLVGSIGGLDDGQQLHSHYRQLAMDNSGNPGNSSGQPLAQQVGLSPKDLATAYDVNPLYAAGVQGQQQSIALLELDGYQRSDVQQYFKSYSLPGPSIRNVLVDHFNGSAGQGSLESTLDIEMVGAIAPRANIFVYEGNSTTQSINNIYTRIVDERRAQIVSLSWGLCEDSLGEAEVRTLNDIFTQGALEGMSFFAASGDSGAYDCQDSNLAVDSPASDPNVTGVGATVLQLNADSSYAGESVWSNPHNALRGPRGAGSGGGVSKFFSQPAWQSAPGVQNQYSNGNREVPDVVSFGDMSTGFSVYCTVKNAGCPPGGWTKIGGTSVAAPFWAASVLLVNQYVQSQNQNTIGLVNPALYKLASTPQLYPAFHPISAGDNLYYQATGAYSFASGLGSPNVFNIARDLAATSNG